MKRYWQPKPSTSDVTVDAGEPDPENPDLLDPPEPSGSTPSIMEDL